MYADEKGLKNGGLKGDSGSRLHFSCTVKNSTKAPHIFGSSPKGQCECLIEISGT